MARLLLLASLAAMVQSQGVTCVACGLIFTLLAQFQNPDAPPGADPDATCTSLGLCDGTCPLYANGTWPVASPVIVTDGGVIDQRRRRLLKDLGVPRSDRVIDFLHALQKEEASRQHPMRFTDAWVASLRFLAMGPCEDGLNITCDISRVFDQHLPLADGDNDYFANTQPELLSNAFRGGDWRGRDCNDTDGTMYPGRSVTSLSATFDHNCNGIAGGNASGSYEAMFCSGANAPMGVVILGDSAAAHFHIPPEAVNARSFNLSGLLELAANEADWPQCSWATGFRNTSDCPTSVDAPMASIYQRMFGLNHCMHRDFQNMGVNGARVGSMAPPNGIINGLARNQSADSPALVIYALIGNDVCDGHPGNGSWTSVAEFRTSVIASLQYLDTVLPAGSHVAFLGLVDGRVLYDTTHNRTHPLGITYPALYEYLSCNGVNPCWGWLNTDEGWRNATSQRAAELTAVYDNITSTMNFTHFDMYRLQVDWVALIAEYAKIADPMNIIEPVDGFHPSQTGHQLLAMTVWNDLAANRSSWLPKPNPFNSEIEAIFGDQGGWG